MPIRISAGLPALHSKTSSYVDQMHPTEERWFALRTGPRKEKLVAKQFERDGITYFLPLRDKPFEYKSKTGVRKIPLLAGYIFVKSNLKEELRILQTTFVHYFVKVGKSRRQITESELNVLKRISVDVSLSWDTVDAKLLLEPGTPVEIRRGSLSGVRGRFIRSKNKHTFVISFGGLDAVLTTCEVSPDDVFPLDAASKSA